MNNQSTSYQLIIAGAGAAGLSLLMRLIGNGYLEKNRVLLIDKDEKIRNDRTWCFWETDPGFFEDIIYRRWSQLDFFSSYFSGPLTIHPYQYKLIRGIDFYTYCFDTIRCHPNITWWKASVQSITETAQGVSVKAEGEEERLYPGAQAFSSIPMPVTDQPNAIQLLQHFKGWVIRTEQPCFDPARATLMDFRISQQKGTAFVYVLPFSAHEALVEYTLFTSSLLEPQQYEDGLRDYLKQYLQLDNYTVTEEEFGVIPMTNTRFPRRVNGVFQLGTAGGQTKPSSGYTFRFIQKQSDLLAAALLQGRPIDETATSAARFRFYDEVLLQVLYRRLYPGHAVFARLFRRNTATQVFRFLDNESKLPAELRLISSLPVWPFLKAALQKKSPY
ncbi:MAG: lycopene cyclase family protein [Chitinophagaceae bacterium]